MDVPSNPRLYFDYRVPSDIADRVRTGDLGLEPMPGAVLNSTIDNLASSESLFYPETPIGVVLEMSIPPHFTSYLNFCDVNDIRSMCVSLRLPVPDLAGKFSHFFDMDEQILFQNGFRDVPVTLHVGDSYYAMHKGFSNPPRLVYAFSFR